MNKILLFAGVVLLCVLILATLFFIGHLGNFAQLLGKQTSNSFVTEKSKFVGSWETDIGLSIYSFKSDGSFIYNYMTGIYKINQNKTVILCYDSLDDAPAYIYYYEFSSNDTMLTFIDIENTEDIVILNKR